MPSARCRAGLEAKIHPGQHVIADLRAQLLARGLQGALCRGSEGRAVLQPSATSASRSSD